MKKAAGVVLILTMAIFLVMPLPGEARGGHWGGGGRGAWWVPWAILGGAGVLASYYYSPYYEPPPVLNQEPPPVNVQPAPSESPSPAEKLFVYPRQGQSEELQARDRYECHGWAVSQTSYDPTQSSAGALPAARRNQLLADYRRAEDACLDARGYSVK
jgi:hypothetical protein